jgi:hypothetical protein
MQRLRIGNGCGFWGDNLDAPIDLARDGQLDYLTLEYLAELTMSILAVQKKRQPTGGFAGDFLDVLERLTPHLRSQPRLRVITNAGGLNPMECARRCRTILDRDGLTHARIGVVSGSDILTCLDELLAQGHSLAHMDHGTPLTAVRHRIVSADVYLGAQPIVEALATGARIVITGRVADASLTVAPLVHDFRWDWHDWDRLAAATVAGHLIECGAQVTGGLWCQWERVPDLAHVGYPIVECQPSGDFVITKVPNTGGAVNRETVTEQLLYEVNNPAAYLTPDVTADFTAVDIQDDGTDRVSVRGAKGQPGPDSYKVSIAYHDGYAAAGTLVIAGPRAEAKARFAGQIIMERLRRAGIEPEHALVEVLGTGDSLPGVLPRTDAAEVVLRLAVRDSRRTVVERFTKEFAPLVTAGPPGVTGYTTGRPAVREVFVYWPALLAKTAVSHQVDLL